MYKFNSELIVRKDDNSLFSLNSMEIYEFNEDGFHIIETLQKQQQISTEEVEQIFVNNTDFFELLLENKILI